MSLFLPTIILRHRKENLAKCSLRGLESREDLRFFTYPKDSLPPLENCIMLSMDQGPLLSRADHDLSLLLIDGTWRYAEVMSRSIPPHIQKRRLPPHFRTAYPRRQTHCPDPSRGLSSVEALYVSYALMGRDPKGLLDHYHWKEAFLKLQTIDLTEKN